MKRFFPLIVATLGLVGSAVGATLTPIGSLNPAGSTSGQAIVSAGPSASPVWGTVVAGSLAPVTANTFIANTTGSTAAPSAKALPSCSTTNSALKYTSGTGLTCGTTFAVTSGNLSQFAATTSAQLAGVLSDETGSGVAVFSASPTFTGTVNTAALTASGAITPSQTAGITGTNTNNNADAGAVGQYICAQVTNGGSPSGCATNSSTPVALTTGVPANVTSISLTAGDWDVYGQIGYVAGGATSVTQIIGAISQTSATFPTLTLGASVLMAPNQTGGSIIIPGMVARLTLASTTTVYLVSQATFSASTESTIGFISARRRR